MLVELGAWVFSAGFVLALADHLARLLYGHPLWHKSGIEIFIVLGLGSAAINLLLLDRLPKPLRAGPADLKQAPLHFRIAVWLVDGYVLFSILGAFGGQIGLPQITELLRHVIQGWLENDVLQLALFANQAALLFVQLHKLESRPHLSTWPIEPA